MSAEVGGRMEAAPGRRLFFGPDYARLLVLGAVAAAVHAWLVVHTAVPARDAVGFARLALNLAEPARGGEPDEPRYRIDVVRSAEHPPGFPAAVCAVDAVLRRTLDLPPQERALLATQLANATAAVLLVVPLYMTGRILYGRNVGFGAALLFQILPVTARVTSDGLSEGLYLLAMTTAVLLAVRAARRPSVGGFLVTGLATGAAYLVRPEGLMVWLGVGAVVAAAGISRRWSRNTALGGLAALGVGVALVAVPYMLLIGKLTNKQTPDAIFRDPLGARPTGIWIGEPGARAPGVGRAFVFAKWWNPEFDEGKNRTLWALDAVASEVAKSLHYVVGVLAVIGLAARRRQLLAPDAGLWVVLAILWVNLLVLFYLAARIGYVSERHTVLVTTLCCLPAAASFGPMARFFAALPLLGRLVIWPRAFPAGLLALVVVTTLPFTLKPMHPQREGHKHAGRYLAEHMDPDDWLVDPLVWGEWYAGRGLYRPATNDTRPHSIWVIWERGKSPHSRIPRWEEAGALTKSSQLVYRWPAQTPAEGPVVEVYQMRLGKPD